MVVVFRPSTMSIAGARNRRPAHQNVESDWVSGAEWVWAALVQIMNVTANNF